MSRAETVGIVNVVWFVSALYFIASPTLAYGAAVVGFGLLAVGFSYTAFREDIEHSVRRRTRR